MELHNDTHQVNSKCRGEEQSSPLLHCLWCPHQVKYEQSQRWHHPHLHTRIPEPVRRLPNDLTSNRKEWLHHYTRKYDSSASGTQMIDQGHIVFYWSPV